jgi:hypothetical protein
MSLSESVKCHCLDDHARYWIPSYTYTAAMARVSSQPTSPCRPLYAHNAWPAAHSTSHFAQPRRSRTNGKHASKSSNLVTVSASTTSLGLSTATSSAPARAPVPASCSDSALHHFTTRPHLYAPREPAGVPPIFQPIWLRHDEPLHLITDAPPLIRRDQMSLQPILFSVPLASSFPPTIDPVRQRLLARQRQMGKSDTLSLAHNVKSGSWWHGRQDAAVAVVSPHQHDFGTFSFRSRVCFIIQIKAGRPSHAHDSKPPETKIYNLWACRPSARHIARICLCMLQS